MFELPEETDFWWNNEWTNSNGFRGLERTKRLIEIDNTIEDLRDELLHCSPHEEEYIYEQIIDLERRKENIERSL